MKDWIYVQAQYGLDHGEPAIWFRHAIIRAASEEDAYLTGRRCWSEMEPGVSLLNDYVISADEVA